MSTAQPTVAMDADEQLESPTTAKDADEHRTSPTVAMDADEHRTSITEATRMSNDFVAAQRTSNKDDEWKPQVGLLFNTLEEAWKLWNGYGGKNGFNVRKQYFNKNKDGMILTTRYVCSKEGIRKPDKRDCLTTNHRLETRTNCPARIGLKYMKEIGKYQIHDVVDEHNHYLHLPETTHMLKSQRKLSQVQAQEIDLADDSVIKQRAVFELMSRQVGGRESLGYTRLDQKNYLRGKRLRNMAYGEAGSLLRHFQQKHIENPSFYHGVQLDVDEQITNIFWADARMIMDYEYFGDVVSLDTTYRKHLPQ
ncbi:protein FAR1-RELATED SEQUENCE 5-like isoform X2 [Lotus japonicus]|uniref:protein FAR1-RELATED SEQUENCE 5-like isoform X2 n=1 Tax=Lotus japonicus TaxID=34305 RepID=UPI00258C5998|nr:protein FAR1-RELATED SEQUENCE 5-like isoform X2 [Lotus japonicus]